MRIVLLSALLLLCGSLALAGDSTPKMPCTGGTILWAPIPAPSPDFDAFVPVLLCPKVEAAR